MTFFTIVVILVLFVLIFKPYLQKYDTVVLYTGGLGSGKSLVSGQTALKLLRKNRAKVRWHNFLQRFHRKNKRTFYPRPLLYTTIPCRVSRKEMACLLDPNVPVLGAGLVERSVVWIDEVSLYIDQLTVKYQNGEGFEEFLTLFRHYTKGGYLVINTQSSCKCNFHIRYCTNTALNLFDFHRLPIIPLYWVKCRNVSLAEDIKTIEEGNAEDNYSTLFGLFPLRRFYDTYAYSERYRDVPKQEERRPTRLKTCHLCRKPSVKVVPLTTDVDPVVDVPSTTNPASSVGMSASRTEKVDPVGPSGSGG